MNDQRSDTILDLLIIGAGPVGLTAALEAKRFGLSVRIIDRKGDRSMKDSRAVVVHPRVMELLEPIRGGAVVSEIAKTSSHVSGVAFYIPNWFNGLSDCGWDTTSSSDSKNNSERNADKFKPVLLDLDSVDWGDTEYQNPSFLPQYETERILEEAFIAEGGKIDYGFSLEDLEQDNGVVTTTLRNTYMDTTESLKSRWVLGADGGRSKTRDLIGAKLNRHCADLYYVIGDIVLKGDPPLVSHKSGKGGHIFPDGPLAFFPLPGKNSYRVAGQTPAGIRSKHDVKMDEKFFEDFFFMKTGRKFEVELGEWRTIFQITHGASDYYRKGNVMLSGDASHVHSPIGGQGMNLGMQDSNNLLWKLAWSKRILKASSSEEDYNRAKEQVDVILETYDTERRSLGMSIVEHIEFATKMFAVSNPVIKFFRNEFLRHMVPSDSARRNFRKMGQLDLAYEPSSSTIIVENHHSWMTHCICSPGQRLPNILLRDGSKLYSHIDRVYHTWVILNSSNDNRDFNDEASETASIPTSWEAKIIRVAAADAEQQISVPVISSKAYAAPQVILVRPDQFVAGVDTSPESIIVKMRKAGMSETALATIYASPSRVGHFDELLGFQGGDVHKFLW